MAVLAVSNNSATISPSGNFSVETTTLINNLTTVLTKLASGNSSLVSDTQGSSSNETNILQQQMLPEDENIHKNPELKYVTTTVIIIVGLLLLILPVFLFVAAVCARSRIFNTIRRAAAGGFGNLNVPYAEFGSAEDYTKADIAPTAASSNSLKIHMDEDDDISSLPPTFVHKPA